MNIIDLVYIFLAVTLANIFSHVIVEKLSHRRFKRRSLRMGSPPVFVPPSKEQIEKEEDEEADRLANVINKAQKKIKDNPENFF